jgi:hypothetical protein
MEELKTTCCRCGREILATTAERLGGLCALCHYADNPHRFELPPDFEQRRQAIDEIRKKVLAGCSAEEFAVLKCPVCASKLKIDTHPRPGDSAYVFVACTIDTSHVAFTDEAEIAPHWWVAHRSGGWLID